MKRLRVFLFIIFISLFIGFVWWVNGTSPVNNNDTTKKTFTIQKGAGIREIASKLKEDQLIKNTVIFFLVVKKDGLDGKIQAGEFRLSPSMNTEEIAESLTHGTTDVWVTIPEGKRAEEIAQLLKQSLPTYQASWETALVQKEGYLFPDTYLIPRDATIETVLALLTGNFDKKYQTISVPNTISEHDVVTIAALVEREAKSPADKKLVSSVIHNRLAMGMPLQIDATVEYAVASIRCPGKPTCNWWSSAISIDDLAIGSLYNTYKNAGLPPTPIANPGLIALDAAANPAKTNYLYYISDKKGVYHYATTLEGHHENIQKYGLQE